jgi:hypothetical protein
MGIFKNCSIEKASQRIFENINFKKNPPEIKEY